MYRFPLIPALLSCSLWIPTAAMADSLNQLACAAAVYCAKGITPPDVQVILDISAEQAQSKFIDASQDWPDTAWRCAAGGRTCGAISQIDAQILIGLPEAAYGPAEQLRERGPASPAATDNQTANQTTTPAQPPRTEGATGKPGIVVETLPAPGAGSYREVTLPAGAAASGAGNIQPQDGVWTLSAGKPNAVGCMAGIAQSVAQGLPAPQSGPIVFEKPFSAKQLIKSDKITWRRLGPNHYAGQLAGASTAMTMSYDVRVASVSQMHWQSIVTVRVPGQSVCTITTPLSHVRQGS